MAAGALPEGDYLSLMNDLKKVYEAIPQVTVVPVSQGNMGHPDAEVMALHADMRFLFGLSPSPEYIQHDISKWRWAASMRGYVMRGTVEYERWTEEGMADNMDEVRYILQTKCHSHHIFRDEIDDAADRVKLLPSYRKALAQVMMRKHIITQKRLALVDSDSQEGLVRLAADLHLPIYLRPSRKHYNKDVPLDPKKHHPVRVFLPTIGGPTTLNCLTPLIQFGRTGCAYHFAEFIQTINIWRYIRSESPAMAEAYSDFLVKHSDIMSDRHRRFGSVLVLEVSGITAKTKNKSRVYSSNLIPEFRITYVEALNNPEA